MTREEHLLMMTMFAQQSQMLEVLTTVLKREGLLTGDDLQAFINVIEVDVSLKTQILKSLMSDYEKVANHFKVPLNLTAKG